MSNALVTVIGAGPVGCLLSAALAGNGLHVNLVERDPERACRAAKLRISSAGTSDEQPHRHITVHESAAHLPPPDWAIVAVKAQQIANALAGLPRFSGTRLLVCANGLVEGSFHLGLLYGGVRLQDSRLFYSKGSVLVTGVLGGAENHTAELAELFYLPGFCVLPEPDIEVRQWHKLALNCVVNPLTALLNCENGKLRPLLDGPLIRGVLEEANMVAHARLGARWDFTLDELKQALGELINETADNTSSMQQDVFHGRETEISHLNLALAALGVKLGLPCPFNEGLGRMVSLLTNRGAL